MKKRRDADAPAPRSVSAKSSDGCLGVLPDGVEAPHLDPGDPTPAILAPRRTR
jgi:hypothetical protein